MLRKLTISGLLGLIGLVAIAAGAQTITLVVVGGLALLGWVALSRQERG